jgi:hypothetical protein
MIVRVGTPGLEGSEAEFFRLYPGDMDFWLRQARGDEWAAEALQRKWRDRNRDMWHFVHDLGYSPQAAESELDYIDDQVFRALMESAGQIMGLGAGISSVAGGASRGGRLTGKRMAPGEKAAEMKTAQFKTLEQAEEELATARSRVEELGREVNAGLEDANARKVIVDELLEQHGEKGGIGRLQELEQLVPEGARGALEEALRRRWSPLLDRLRASGTLRNLRSLPERVVRAVEELAEARRAAEQSRKEVLSLRRRAETGGFAGPANPRVGGRTYGG